MPEEKPPWLFIYFRHRIRVIQPMRSEPDPSAKSGFKFVPRNELWITGIGPDAMVQYAVPKIYVDMWDRHFIALFAGYHWSGFLWPDFENLRRVALTFSPADSNEIALYIFEEYINRIYDIANRRHILQIPTPNPPH